MSNVIPDTPAERNAMSFTELVSWGWGVTPPTHRCRANLLIHIVAVPMFVIGHLMLIAGIVITPWLFGAALLCILASLLLQKHGHSLEQVHFPPFAGSRDLLGRIYSEQFINFWRFLLSGQWYASLKARRE